MKKLLLSLLLFTYGLANGQVKVSTDFTCTLGTPYKVIDAGSKYYFSKGDEIMTVKIDGKEIIIQKLSAKTLSFIKLQAYESMPKGSVIESINEFAGRYYIFYSLWEKPFEQLYAREIDFASGQFVGKDLLLIKTDVKIAGSGTGWGMWGIPTGFADKFSFQYSFDRTKLLIQYRLKPEVKDDDVSHDIIGMNVFDKNLAALWRKEVTMPYTEKKMNNIDYSLDSEGNAFLLSTVYNDNTTKLKKGEKPNYHIELIRIKAVTGELRATTIGLGDKFINKIWMYENGNKDMLCAGYYTKTQDTDNADGVFMFKIDKEGKAYDLVSHEIPVKVLNQYLSAREQKKNEKKDEEDRAEFTDLELRDVIVQNDGSVILIGEQYYTVTRTYTTTTSTGGMTTRSVTYYYYNDMLITKLDPKGNLAWMQKLAKRQARTGGYGKGGMSYQYMSKEGSHYLLFLDNKKNMDLPLNEIPAMHSDGQGGFLTAYKVDDANGNVSKLSLFDTRDVQGTEVYQFMTDRIVPLSNNEFVIEVYKKKKEDVLIKVTLDK